MGNDLIEAEGLQWYCHMCQIQCRNESIFNCHCMSKSHQRHSYIHSDLDKNKNKKHKQEREFLGDKESTTVNKEIPKPDQKLDRSYISFTIHGKPKRKILGISKCVFDEIETESEVNVLKKRKPTSALDEIMIEEEMEKERNNRKGYWLSVGIEVKVVNSRLANKYYYNKKGVVLEVVDKYFGIIEMFDGKHQLLTNQQHLQTTIPHIGGQVKIINGEYRGSTARLLAVDTDKYCATVQIERGLYHHRIICGIAYDDICKIA